MPVNGSLPDVLDLLIDQAGGEERPLGDLPDDLLAGDRK
jgi:hypothetical protein